MKKRIKRVAILGSGTMGSGIAAHLANAGIRSYLLDIVPTELTEADKSKGLTPESPEFRNQIAENNKQALLKARPAQLMNKEDIDLITAGNMEDNLAWLSECDWIVEVVPENLEVKKAVLKKIQPYIKPGTIVTTNTSGISVNRIAEEMPLEFRQYWLGTHFFNPVRYMKLLEIIPCRDTLPEVVRFMADFGEKVLGKGIVFCKDTPNFIANRLGVNSGCSIANKTVEFGLTVPEVDAIAGPAMGRPSTAFFGLIDLVGLDIAIASGDTVYNNVEDPAEKQLFVRPNFYYEMRNRGLLGNKTKAGFYKKEGKEKLAIDLNTFEYKPIKPVSFPSLETANKEKTLARKLEAFFEGDDVAAKFVWKHIRDTFVYAASKIPEIADNILDIDRAMRWGYNYAAGPFEMWTGMDLPKYVARMEAEGVVVPAWVKEMLAAGFNSFYKTEDGIEYYYSIPEKKYVPIQHKPEVIVLAELKAKNKVIKANEAGTIYDIGDGVICLQLHTRTGAINAGVIEIIKQAQEELAQNWEGLVITGSGRNFCVGADLNWVMEQITAKNWAEIDRGLKMTQDVYLANKYSDKPVVVAPFGMTLGGGCEMAMHSSAIQAAGETYFGLVEVGVGLIPAGGGLKEMTMRAMERIKGTSAFAIDFITPYFQNIMTAKVSTSGKEGVDLGYMRPTDRITLNNDFLIADAKKRVLELIDIGYTPLLSKPFPAVGQNGLGLIKSSTRQMMHAGYMSEYDWHIACKIVDVMAGGQITAGTMINEQYLLDLEREVFLSLCGEQKTQDRIVHMLTKGKPLRN
ncbi:MAG: 3-hydroxyacyl-CoA dehydrogenase [Firmicutes bacterium]|nr:3-hydroxyacyl-CoA dehydrogenase [Bacillota bacterium]